MAGVCVSKWIVMSALAAVPLIAQPQALPQIGAPFAGDPRLEPLPVAAVTLADFPAWANGVPVTMRFPPRVNGQSQSDGDASADLYVLFYGDNGERVNQRVILEAVPKGAAVAVSNATARIFSPIWRIRAATVSRSYDPNNALQRIDSVSKLATLGFLQKIYSSNIFWNAPVVPAGSTVPRPGAPLVEAFYEAQVVMLAPADINDGASLPQTLFKFEDPLGNILPSATAPHLVASRTAGNFFHSSIWEIWTIRVPTGFDVTALRSRTQFLDASGVPLAPFTVHSAGIRLNAPVSAVNGVTVPVEDVFTLLTNTQGRFDPAKFPFDVAASQFQKQQTFLITSIQNSLTVPAALPLPPVDPGGKGNVIPVILRNPFQTMSSGPNTAGPFVRIDQAELDAARLNTPARLPAAIEANISSLIGTGLLTPDWAPGVRPYVQRLAMVGRALHELIYRPEDGANSKDVTSCVSCHTRSKAGGGGRALFNLGPEQGPTANPSSFWGSGAAELLNGLKRAAGGVNLTFAHGSLGLSPKLRDFAASAPNRHFGIQSAEFVASQTGNPAGFDPVTDLDGDGIANEMSVGEVTAETVWMATLPVPDLASPALRLALGISDASLASGKLAFRRSIDAGGAGCGGCHQVFHSMSSTTLLVRNPQTTSALAVPVPHHAADSDDVADGLATAVGEAGLRLFGDFRLHKMGSLMASTGIDTFKTAELWDVGSTYPFPRGGEAGSDLTATILAHEGVPLTTVSIIRGQQSNVIVGSKKISKQLIVVQNTGANAIPASLAQPIRVILAGNLTPGILAFNAAASGPGGTFRQGAVWHIAQPIQPGAVALLQLQFENSAVLPLQYELVVETHAGFSEAAASIRAFRGLAPTVQNDLVNYLRAQVIGDALN